MSPERPRPLQHRSAFINRGPLEGVGHLDLSLETPLFAADRAYALAHGGAITRAFVEALPAHWTDPVIDTWLAWVTPGMTLDDEYSRGVSAPFRAPPLFRHEPFPGALEGVKAACNRNQAATHRWLILGAPEVPVFAVGEVCFDNPATAAEFWTPEEDLVDRDVRVRQQLDAGQLRALAWPRGEILETGWGALWCPRLTEVAGFQFKLRASHLEPRPIVNGHRNGALM